MAVSESKYSFLETGYYAVLKKAYFQANLIAILNLRVTRRNNNLFINVSVENNQNPKQRLERRSFSFLRGNSGFLV